MSETLKAMQQIETETLKAFINVCEQLNLKYYVICGTLLGAVRHKGFIPWDDDIDVGMFREDYNIFLEKGQSLMPEGYFIQTNVTDKEYPLNFAKIRNSNTTFIESSLKDKKINHGLYIDVFPLDYFPDGILSKIFVEFKNGLMKSRISMMYSANWSWKHKLLRILSRRIYQDGYETVQKRNEYLASVPKSSLTRNYCGDWNEIVPADWFGEGVSLDFEDLKVVAPKEYDKYLTHVFGDYNTLPPIEERIPHHYIEVIDLDSPYTKYTEKE